MAEQETALEDPVAALRVRMIETFREGHPVLGQFSPEQYLAQEGGMGDVFVSRWKKGMPFTNLKSKHVKPLLINYWIGEVHRAAWEKRAPRLDGLIAYFEWLMANLGGWLAEQYVRTGIAGLAPPPKKPGRLARFFGRG